jgi:hypothetical protein
LDGDPRSFEEVLLAILTRPRPRHPQKEVGQLAIVIVEHCLDPDEQARVPHTECTVRASNELELAAEPMVLDPCGPAFIDEPLSPADLKA